LTPHAEQLNAELGRDASRPVTGSVVDDNDVLGHNPRLSKARSERICHCRFGVASGDDDADPSW
jgi:hypothetical protein